MTDDDAAMKPARLPRGVKPVAKAFFTALDTVPDASRTAVAKAAQAMIREQLKLRREKLREGGGQREGAASGGCQAEPGNGWQDGGSWQAQAPRAQASRGCRRLTQAPPQCSPDG